MDKTVLVPREPTFEMIEAYFEACRKNGFTGHVNASCAWEAMIDAAPLASECGEGENDPANVGAWTQEMTDSLAGKSNGEQAALLAEAFDDLAAMFRAKPITTVRVAPVDRQAMVALYKTGMLARVTARLLRTLIVPAPPGDKGGA